MTDKFLSLFKVCFAILLASQFGGRFILANAAPAEDEAPHGWMASGNWTTGNKDWVSTAYEDYDSTLGFSSGSPTAPISNVWATGGTGVLQEVYWPTIDRSQVRQSELVIRVGDEWISDSELTHQTTWIEGGVPRFRVHSEDSKGRFEITKEVFTDPDRPVVIQSVEIEAKVPTEVYWHHQSAAGNTPFGDSGKVRLVAEGVNDLRTILGGGESALIAWQANQYQALMFSIPVVEATAGFNGSESDGRVQLRRFGKFNQVYAKARDGRVVLTAKLSCQGFEVADGNPRKCKFVTWLGFGDSEERAIGEVGRSRAGGAESAAERFSAQWNDYQRRVTDLAAASSDGGKVFRASVAVLKSLEDKTYPGSFVASPTIPWGQYVNDMSSAQSTTGGYHLIWPRDLFQMATAFLALGDVRTAKSCLNAMVRLQFGPADGEWDQYGHRRRKKDGSFPQNVWVNGQTYWPGLQLDQTAMPVILTFRLWKNGAIQPAEYWNMARRALDFIADFGPWTGQERWEENFGASPSTIAAEIAALWVGAELADAVGDHERARRYRTVGDAWSSKPGDNLEAWTYTRTGSFANGSYYQRIEGARRYDQIWNPNDDVEFYLSNQGGSRKEKTVTDAGFLELVRYGVRRAGSPEMTNSILAVDQTLRAELGARGVGFRRYYGDRYSYDDRTGTQTEGMPWILLVGERAHYELALAADAGFSTTSVRERVRPYLVSMEKLASSSMMLPEQVWDAEGATIYGRRRGDIGESNGSATPLGWSHGEYIKLLRSLTDNRIFDEIEVVKNRSLMLEALGWDFVVRLIH